MGENGKRMNLLILLRMSTENKISEYLECGCEEAKEALDELLKKRQ